MLREENARLAVAADQARITDDLGGFLQDRVARIAADASTGLAALAQEPDQAEDAFVAIQGTGRETLNHMRGVVAALKDQTSTEPQPVLAQLDRLLGQATRAKARLQVTGDARHRKIFNWCRDIGGSHLYTSDHRRNCRSHL